MHYQKQSFFIGTGVYMLPSNLNFNTGKAVRYNNKILISNANTKWDPNKDIKKAEIYHKKSPVTPPESTRSHRAPYLISHYTFDLRGWVNCLSFLVGLNAFGVA